MSESEEPELSGRVAAVEVLTIKGSKPVTVYIPTTEDRRFCIRKTGIAFFMSLEKAEGKVPSLTKEGAPASEYVAFDEEGILTDEGRAALAERWRESYTIPDAVGEEAPEAVAEAELEVDAGEPDGA